MKIKKFKTSLIALSIISCGVHADYIVYPQGKVNLSLPEIDCQSDVSTLDDGMYILCSQENDVEYPVVNGQAFKISLENPADGFTCEKGERYSNRTNKGYAFDEDARDLSILTNKNIYTPNGSWMQASTMDSRDSKGNARYVKPDGTFEESLMYIGSKRYSIEVNIYYKNNGDGYSLKPATKSNSSYRTYYPHSKNTITPAYRACLIE